MTLRRFIQLGGLLVSACLAAGGGDVPASATKAVRPYEIVDAGRTSDEVPPTLRLGSADGWRAVCSNAEATVSSATDRPLFADGSLRVDYRAIADGPIVGVELSEPVRVAAFDAVSVWVYGNNFYGCLTKPGDTPTTEVRACFSDAEGRPFDFVIGYVRHRQWSKFQQRVPKELRERAASGQCRFCGFSLSGGTNRDWRRMDFTSVCVFREEFRPLEFAPRARRGVQVFPDAPQGANVGTGRLPFPTVETTIVPPATEIDSTLEFRFPSDPGVWDDLAFRVKGGPWIPLAQGGGVWPRAAANAARATFRRIGNSVVADVRVPGGCVEELRFGTMATGSETQRIVVPFLHYGRYQREDAPMILSVEAGGVPRFVSAMFDWSQSNASEPFAGKSDGPGFAANGGVRYIPKTDGVRNDVYERFVWTVSPKFEDALPFIPNPKSPWKAVTGRGCWVADPAKPGRIENDAFWRKMTRRGIRRMIVTDHEAAWRDEDESFTFKTNCAAGKGGDAGQYRWTRHMIDKLGFRYGPYNNFTDLAPINRHWHSDHALRRADGNFLESWSRCFSPKPLYGLEMCERLTPVIQRKFGFNTAYCDVHTAVPPWSRTDYDARVPGAATFAQTYYAYGEILLLQRKIWGGPVWSEGYSHWMYAGLVDGNYGQDRIYELCKNPWLVDFDLRRLHPLECDHGMGYSNMLFGYEDGAVPKDRWDILSRWMPLTLIFGHTPFLLPEHRTYAYYMALAIASRYSQENVKDIRYADAKGELLDTSAAIVSGAYQRNAVAVTYDGGTFVAVNGNREGEHFRVPRAMRSVDLPPWGIFATGGDVLVYSGCRGGLRYDFCRGGADAGYVYMNGRGKPMSCAGGATDGEVVRLREAGGTEEVIPLEAVTRLELPYAAKRIVGLSEEKADELGEVKFTVDARGWTHLAPAEDVFSYRVWLPDGYVEPPVEAYERELTENVRQTQE